MNNDVMFSSANQAWATRWEDFDRWDTRFNFTLDVCAGNNDQKCERYFTPELDGLKQSWQGETFFCNPPYGREYPAWIKYAIEQAKLGVSGMSVIPARTDTILFHDHIVKAENEGLLKVEFLRGRLTFGSDEYWAWVWEQEELNGKKNSLYKKYGKTNAAPFPSVLLKFGKCKHQ